MATQNEIRQKAYNNWQKRGCPIGDAMTDWLAAEAALNAANGGEADTQGGYHRILAGTWNNGTSLSIEGGQGLRFKLRNLNVLGTTISITDDTFNSTHQAMIPPLSSVQMDFSCFGAEPMVWRFTVETNSDAFMVAYEVWSTWAPGMPANG